MSGADAENILRAALSHLETFWFDTCEGEHATREQFHAYSHAVVTFERALANTPVDGGAVQVFEALKSCILRINALNADDQLIETDEREILATAIIEAAAAKGLDLSAYKHSDPTFEIRDW